MSNETFKFQIGDKVKVTKPENEKEFPGWPPSMEEFNGQIMVVTNSFIEKSYYLYNLKYPESSQPSHFQFGESWLTLVESVPVDIDKKLKEKRDAIFRSMI